MKDGFNASLSSFDFHVMATVLNVADAWTRTPSGFMAEGSSTRLFQGTSRLTPFAEWTIAGGTLGAWGFERVPIASWLDGVLDRACETRGLEHGTSNDGRVVLGARRHEWIRES